MHENTIQLLREESCRLLQVEIELLQRMKTAKGVVVDEKADEHQTFSSASIDKDLKMLQGEASKLERLEMVLAVVGTMKAGKSTTINAIVGTEVLPNRNRPMTVLPTRIRHTPGKKEPVLSLDNNQSINDLIVQLKQALENTPAGNQVLTATDHDKDMSELLRFVQSKERFKKEYRGPESIFWFLKSLNDLVRLSFELDVKFPFDRYAGIDDIPLIEVEFAHLANLPDSVGSLTLLDTPGPNEAGQEHLRPMLREQLQNASAILAILDFTQLKSDADQQVRQELERIADVAHGRMFALVNKFDEKDRNGDDEEQTRKLVAHSLLKGQIDVSHVFPVSSKFADLANRALRELEINGCLPDPVDDSTAWVEDFGKAALGAMWKMLIGNQDVVRQAASALWESSKFAAPLTDVIHKAHSQAAMLAISASAAKLVDVATKLNNFLDVRKVALGKNASELAAQIDSLRSDIESIGALETRSQSDAKKALDGINKQISNAFAEIRKSIREEVDQGFQKAKETEEKQVNVAKSAAPQVKRSLFGSLLNIAIGHAASSIAGSKFGREFDPKNPIIKLDTQKDAEEVISGIEKGVQQIIANNESTLADQTDSILNAFREKFEDGISVQASTIVGELNQRLKGCGFSIAIKMPASPALSLKQGRGEFLRGVIESKQRSVTKRRRSSSLWGGLCGLFNTDDWGWESYSTTEGYYEVDINKVRKSISDSIDGIFEGLGKAVVDTVQAPLQESVKQFFDELKLTVESLRSDLAQSIRDKETTHEQQKSLADTLAGFKREVPGLRHDAEALHRDVCPAPHEVVA